MNIIIDKLTHDILYKTHIRDTIEFGSPLHGTKDENSDTDLLHILEPSTKWLSAPYNTDHLLQYKDEENNTDHIYVTPQTFVRGLVNGDNAIFHEIYRLGGLKGTILEWLQDIDFNHYKILRAYLGLARRDVKETTKLWKDERKCHKKLRFAIESVNFVANELKLNKPVYLPVFPETVMDLHRVAKDLGAHIDEVRMALNVALESGELQRTPNHADFAQIDYELWMRHEPDANYETGLSYFRESYINGN